MSGRALAAIALLIAPAAAAQDVATQRAVTARAADLIAARYVDPATGARVAAALRAEAAVMPAAPTPQQFALNLTARLRALSGDGHFALTYNPASRATASGEAIDPVEVERWYGAHVNHGFEQVARLEGGVGYLDLRVFAPTAIAGDMAAAAMTLLAQSPALIIDLRHNGGGLDDMTRLLAAYLLDRPREMSATYDRPSGRTRRYFTPPRVSGRRFGGSKPVYVLVSTRTFSAAEAFAYDLQAIKRATIVGEQTAGGANPFADRPVGHGFVLSLPEQRSVNPVTRGNWQGRGVTPDVRVPADQALQQALALAKGNAATNK